MPLDLSMLLAWVDVFVLIDLSLVGAMAIHPVGEPSRQMKEEVNLLLLKIQQTWI